MPRGKRVAKRGAVKKTAVKKTTTKKTAEADTGYVVALKKPPTDPLDKVLPSEPVTPPAA